jgi:glycosyltransferase involved in cell wall biosynthesis
MKVLLLSNGFQPNYEKAFANGLAENAVQVELISSDRTLRSGLDSRVIDINIRGSQNPQRSRMSKALNILRYSGALARHILSGRHAVVHLFGLFMTKNVAAGVLECLGYRLLSRRFFMTVHNLLPHDQHTRMNHRLFGWIYRLPHKLVVHTEGMKTGLVEQFGISPGRIVVMPHGVDAVPESAPQNNSPSIALRVLLFGALSPYKGTDLLLRALAFCPDIPVAVTIAGECRKSDYASEIEALIHVLKPNHTVVWQRGYLPEDKVRDYFESADVVALPYRHIDQSGVLFTAFRFGVPVIATDVGAFRESLPSFAGLISPHITPEAIAASLREFFNRRGEFDRDRIRQHARTLAWSQTVRPLVASYQEACA